MPVFLDTPAITAMVEGFDAALPLLRAELDGNTENIPFEVLAERHIDPLLRAGIGRAGRTGNPAEYHVPNMIVLATSMAMGHQAAKNMVASAGDGHQPGADAIKRTVDLFRRLEAFVTEKVDREMHKRFASIATEASGNTASMVHTTKTPSVSTTGFVVINHHEAATTDSVNESDEDWDLV
ncbi:hypothetical protein QBC39DRAFT_380156 [Podospora conica]|nr:hypothetical protein QBC39DRAFT_380156 [Schizothecium conicum]